MVATIWLYHPCILVMAVTPATMKRQKMLFELKVVRCHQKEGDEVSNDDEDSGDDPCAKSSGFESSDNDSSSELLSTGDTSINSNSVPADISQSKYHSPIQPILKNYPRTTFGTGKKSQKP